MPRVVANGIDAAYVESGSGEPLVLLHGGNGDRTQFDGFRPLLGDGIRAIAYDQRDAPEAPYTSGSYAMSDHADDCAAFIEALGLERAHVMGTSYGGAVALATAVAHPDRVQSLILASTTPAWSLVEPMANEAVALLAEPDGHQRLMLRIALTDDAIANDPALVAELTATMRTRTPEADARRMGAVAAFDCRSQLASITAPTLVLHGDEDPVISPATAQWMAEQIPGAEFRLQSGVRHGITLQKREETAEVVRAFVLAHRVSDG